MNIARGDERHARGLSRTLPLAQPSLVARAAMQLGHCVGSIRKDFPPPDSSDGSQVRAREQCAEK